ncbi:hypothetical protein [Pseudonocardia hydrocarbonoxydans]|uniref:Uncharacterized protein n=1 Tax=Pseudonocardia hydrocarbonoxydans TaxID=76726 RepID=A0A4Y3WJY2_9PSEU|nr:hypothetical protein [Pseudonocardia hydrocarbonoxydans]GEC19055.1 hypothetical protein PHY01_13380 [Pseudonocardia hydrocarbonoxydans]
MQVRFTRTGERRYSVTVARPAGGPVAVDPAPGFHPQIPHDLAHFVVERHLGLRGGIYGSLAAGGDAGMFRPVDEPYTRKWGRRNAQRTDGPDMLRSERLAGLLQAAWEVRHGGRRTPPGVRAWMDGAGADVDAATLRELVDRLDELAARWRALPVGGSLDLDWPDAPGRR